MVVEDFANVSRGIISLTFVTVNDVHLGNIIGALVRNKRKNSIWNCSLCSLNYSQ